MVIRLLRFNLKVLVILSLALGLSACQSPEAKQAKQKATFRVHLETNPNPPLQSERIQVLRAAPINVNIEKSPFLNEVHLAAARVVDTGDGFVILVKLNQQGQWLLEQYSTGNSNRRFAIRSQFRLGTNVFDRWLAAPLITRPITDGVLTFTPDADRAEAKAMVQGWNNVAGYEDKAGDFNAKFSETP